MDLVEVRKIVGKIKNSLFKNSNAYSIGMLKSHFKGSGLQFKDHQVYTHGDDVRFIDWKILAKTNVPYIKTFNEERNVEIVVIIDISPTMFFGLNNVSKLQAAIEITSLLYILAKETNDYISVLLIADEATYIPNKRGDEGISYLISILKKKNIVNGDGEVNTLNCSTVRMEYKDKVNAIMKFINKRREVVIFSDFHDFIKLSDVSRIIFKANVHCFKITSPLDKANTLPFALFSTVQNSDKTHLLGKMKINEKEETEKKFKIKEINVENRYLEEFIKEMI